MSLAIVKEKFKRSTKPEMIRLCNRYGCALCPLDNAKVNSPKMEPSGAEYPVVYFLAEAPGRIEDDRGEPLIGPSGQLLRRVIPNRYKDKVRFNNCVRTRPPNNRTPTYIEIECCRKSIEEDIEESKPKAIIGLGNIPLKWMTGQSGISAWRGRIMPVKVGSHECWFLPTFHPALILRRGTEIYGEETQEYRIFKKDIRSLFREIEAMPDAHVFPREDIENNVQLLGIDRDAAEVNKTIRLMEELASSGLIAIDLETTCLRPYDENAKILSISMCDDRRAIAFPIDHSESAFDRKSKEKIWNKFVEIILDRSVQKIVHNSTFEYEWLIEFIGRDVAKQEPWHDTLAQAYVLDARKGVLSLECLTIQYYGFNLKSYSDVNVKKLSKEPLNKVLLYNALDSKFEYMLFQDQMRKIEIENLKDVYYEQIRRNRTVSLTQAKGLLIDKKQNKNLARKYALKIKNVLDKIHSYEEVKMYKQNSEDGEFNIGSPNQLGLLLDRYFGIPIGKTDKGNYSTGKDILEELDIPIAKDAVLYRNLKKMHSTYIVEFSENGKYYWPDGRLHPKFNTAHVVTRRFSSSEPNGQNFPKTENKEIRRQIIPEEGCLLLSCDYGQMEICVVAILSRDTKLRRAIKERHDIHMEWSQRIAYARPSLIGGKKFIKDKDEMKKFRSKVKNGFVFPLLYGSSTNKVGIAMGLEGSILYKLVDAFWHQMPGVKRWHKIIRETYKEYGYLEAPTGFRFREPLDVTKLINYPVQCTASEIVVNSMNRISEYSISKDKEYFQPILNIHDDLTFSIPEKSFDEDAETIIKFMLNPDFDFISVPLSVEASYGKNWCDMEDIGVFFSDEF